MKEGFENVFRSHTECWHTPNNLQTNETGRLEVKLAINVWPPYIQTSNNIVELSLPFPPLYQMWMSFKEMGSQYKAWTVTEKSKYVPIPHTDRRHYSLRSLQLFCFDLILWFFNKSYMDMKGEKRNIYRNDYKQNNRDRRRNQKKFIKQSQFSEHESKGERPHWSVK